MINKKMATKRLTMNAVLIAVYVVLRFFNIPMGNSFRFTLAAFPVVLCALLYGPADGLLVGLLGEFLSQVLGPYGLTPTTLLWCLGETMRGGVLGLCSILFLRKGMLRSKKPEKKTMISMLVCCVITGILAALGQTFALYVDSKMFGYYSYAMVFGSFVLRIITGLVATTAMAALTIPLYTAMRRAKLAP